MMKKKKFNCYECEYRGTIPGVRHSKCCYPGLKNGMLDIFAGNSEIIKKLKIRGNEHGIKSGWFMWPCNFDPVWLENCEGFKERGIK